MTSPGIYDTPNNMFPHRAGYVRPGRADDLQPDQTATSARQFKGTVFEQALAAIAHAQNAYQRHVDATNADKHRYSPQGYQEQITGFGETAAAKAIADHVDRVKARRDQAQAHVAQVRRTLSPDGDTAGELRATRYWNRTKAVLDAHSTPDVVTRGTELISQATPAELGTLLQELEPYCVARGVASTDWIDAAVGQSSPEYGRAVKQLTKAQQSVVMVEHNARRLQNAIATGQQVLVPLARPTRDGDYDPDR